jgi:hypothetical protein
LVVNVGNDALAFVEQEKYKHPELSFVEAQLSLLNLDFNKAGEQFKLYLTQSLDFQELKPWFSTIIPLHAATLLELYLKMGDYSTLTRQLTPFSFGAMSRFVDHCPNCTIFSFQLFSSDFNCGFYSH